MGISPEEMVIYKKAARKKEAQLERKTAERHQLALSLAQTAAQHLKQNFDASQVILFGSLAHGAWFHANSDIDLAVTGISPELFWKAAASLDRLDTQFEINLVALEDVSARLHVEIDRDGIEL